MSSIYSGSLSRDTLSNLEQEFISSFSTKLYLDFIPFFYTTCINYDVLEFKAAVHAYLIYVSNLKNTQAVGSSADRQVIKVQMTASLNWLLT